MKVLIVGAGAVGQVYAHYLIKGGAELSFYCKEKYKAELEKGLSIYQHGLVDKLVFSKPRKRVLGKFGIFTSLDELKPQSFDYVLLAISSSALRSGWFPEFAAACTDSVIVSLQVASEDGNYIKESVNEANYCNGFIQFSAYDSPLTETKKLDKKETFGLHYLLPPIAGLLDGEKAKALSLVLNRGGFRNHLKKSLDQHAAITGTITIPLVAALEMANWEFKNFYQSNYLDLGLQAGAEAKAVTLAIFDTAQNKPVKPINSLLVKILLKVVQAIAPYDFEKFIIYHFDKVNEQTLLMMKDYQSAGNKYQIKTPAIDKIINSLDSVIEL